VPPDRAGGIRPGCHIRWLPTGKAECQSGTFKPTSRRRAMAIHHLEGAEYSKPWISNVSLGGAELGGCGRPVRSGCREGRPSTARDRRWALRLTADPAEAFALHRHTAAVLAVQGSTPSIAGRSCMDLRCTRARPGWGQYQAPMRATERSEPLDACGDHSMCHVDPREGSPYSPLPSVQE